MIARSVSSSGRLSRSRASGSVSVESAGMRHALMIEQSSYLGQDRQACREEAAVDVDRLACQPGCVQYQEAHGFGDIGRRAEPAHRGPAEFVAGDRLAGEV